MIYGYENSILFLYNMHYWQKIFMSAINITFPMFALN